MSTGSSLLTSILEMRHCWPPILCLGIVPIMQVSPPVWRFFDQRARHRVAVDSAHSEGASYRRERQSHSLAPATSRCLPLRYYFNSGRCHSTVKSQSFFKRVVNGPWRIARIGLVAALLTQRLCWLPPSRHRHLLPHRHQVQAPRPHPIRFS